MPAIVKGDRELLRNLAVMSRVIAARDIDAGIQTALRPMEEQTRRNAFALRQPRRKAPRGGHLDEGVVTVRRKSMGLRREWWVSFRKRAIKIAHLVEFGTRPHWQPRRFGGWMHPGARPRYFFTRAFEAKRKEAVTGFSRAIWLRIESAAMRLGGGR